MNKKYIIIEGVLMPVKDLSDEKVADHFQTIEVIKKFKRMLLDQERWNRFIFKRFLRRCKAGYSFKTWNGEFMVKVSKQNKVSLNERLVTEAVEIIEKESQLILTSPKSRKENDMFNIMKGLIVGRPSSLLTDNINTILSLKFKTASFLQIQDKLRDAIETGGSRKYVSLYKKDLDGKWKRITKSEDIIELLNALETEQKEAIKKKEVEKANEIKEAEETKPEDLKGDDGSDGTETEEKN